MHSVSHSLFIIIIYVAEGSNFDDFRDWYEASDVSQEVLEVRINKSSLRLCSRQF